MLLFVQGNGGADICVISRDFIRARAMKYENANDGERLASLALRFPMTSRLPSLYVRLLAGLFLPWGCIPAQMGVLEKVVSLVQVKVLSPRRVELLLEQVTVTTSP